MIIYNVTVGTAIIVNDTIGGTATQTVSNQFWFGIFLSLFLGIIIQGFCIRFLYDIYVSKSYKFKTTKRKYIATILIFIFLIILFWILWNLAYQTVIINLHG